jgi:hypothetical protein
MRAILKACVWVIGIVEANAVVAENPAEEVETNEGSSHIFEACTLR